MSTMRLPDPNYTACIRIIRREGSKHSRCNDRHRIVSSVRAFVYFLKRGLFQLGVIAAAASDGGHMLCTVDDDRAFCEDLKVSNGAGRGKTQLGVCYAYASLR